ncbi:BRD4-interacting chromatin-remodeling complex-associated protein [Aplochiton taeniatus]
MDDEDGTCLLDVLCDPQALNDFLHGTNELQNEDLLISGSSGEPSLFTDAPSPVSLLAEDGCSQDTSASGCVDLSFLEEALLASPVAEEGNEDPQLAPTGAGLVVEGDGGKEEKVKVGEEREVACDILQQSLQEADITEQTMALEAGLVQPGGDSGLSLYSPTPLLSSPPAAAVPYLPKPVTFPITPTAFPRDTQAAVEPPQPSLLAVGPGCPSLKPAAPQLMGLVPGNVFPAPPAETSFSLSHAQASSMIIHKAMPSMTGHPLITPTFRTTAGPGIVLQQRPFPIQPKLPINIQPRLVQISPKPALGQKPPAGLTFVPGTASPNILLSPPPPGPKPARQPQPAGPQLPKPLSLQLVNQGGSFVLQPQGLFQGQSQFLLPGQAPVTLSQPGGVSRPLLTPSHQGPAVQSVTPSAGHLVDGSQILTVPHRQLNFGPLFAGTNGQLALRQATVLSGPLQLHPAPQTAVFQMPTQLAGAYAPPGQPGGQRATLVHSPALGNHITLINSSGMLPPDLTSISILNGPPVVQGLPYTPQGPPQRPAGGMTEAQLSLQQASVVLLPERMVPEERSSPEEHRQQLPQPHRHLLQHVTLQPTTVGLQAPSPPMVTLLQAPQEALLAAEPAVLVAKHLVPQTDSKQLVQEVPQQPLSQSQAFMHQLQQQALSSPNILPAEVLVKALPVLPVESIPSPAANEKEVSPLMQAIMGQAEALSGMAEPCLETTPSPLRSEMEDSALLCPSPTGPDLLSAPTASASFSPLTGASLILSEREDAGPDLLAQPEDPAPALSEPQAQILVPARAPAPAYGSHSPPLPDSVPVPPEQPVPLAVSAVSDEGAIEEPAVQQHTQSTPTAALAMEGILFTLDVRPPSPPTPQGLPLDWLQTHTEHAPGPHVLNVQQTGAKVTGLAEQGREEWLTPAMRGYRVQQRLCLDHAAVQSPYTCSPFSTLEDAVTHLLPYHSCAGHLPTQEDFDSVDEEFDTVSGFLLKRTKDMVNKYRQLLIGEAQQESPSAEMVMLERLFLQAERLSLGEDRRRARRDPESFLIGLHASGSSQRSAPSTLNPAVCPSGSPSSSPPSWTKLSDRPPGLRTYHSSTRGALRLTIKQESGSRKVVHNSACDSVCGPPAPSGPIGQKRDHTGQLTNGGSAVKERNGLGNISRPHPKHDETISNGTLPMKTAEKEKVVPGIDGHLPAQKAMDLQVTPTNTSLSRPEAQASCLVVPRDEDGPRLKRYRPDPSRPEWSERLEMPELAVLQEDHMLSEHLQSAIDSILELQQLQGPTVAQPGPALDQAFTSILGGRL